MEYSPPPLFKQGASARAKVIIFSLIAISLLVVDARMNALTMVRRVVGTALYPLQAAALAPRDALFAVGSYFTTIGSLQRENDELHRRAVANAQSLQENSYLANENAHLRRLLSADVRVPVKSIMAEMLYDTRDPFTRKIVLNRGSAHGLALGQPVIDEAGVVGQVTRLFPYTSEVTLLTDKDQAISVQVVRSGLRSVAYGRGQSGVLELRFIAANADIKPGDALVTSGIDGVFPAGLAVAAVTTVEHKSGDSFAQIVCQPAAGISRNKQFLVLLNELKPPPPMPQEEPKKDKSKKKMKDPGKEAAKDAAKDGAKAAPPEGARDSAGDAKPGADKDAAKSAAAAKATPQAAVKTAARADSAAPPARSGAPANATEKRAAPAHASAGPKP
ncbi:rod shape-determining protein MreC [Noviherbaspirillum pedocola]|uniref:Cell shape-determining protein MreC n=1 Tax=Noviherbaspirillum pedocola TaxID=2801341 RepID=A0A934W849_9BURK|nr:rod shape-determining protein MreC [Noviherbaspirillum pedocola]MBK4736393.1 rod shape-determining protein MreC [Noviherbaspirillum pedocola]